MGAWVALIAGAVVMLASVGSQAHAAAPGKVTICHATASQSNPYVPETVDISSLGDGHGQNGINPGDIVPPTPGTDFPNGNNWTATGQTYWNNNCKAPTQTSPPATEPASSSAVPSSPATTATQTVSSSAAPSSSAPASAGVSGVATTSAGPVPVGVSAGQHARARGSLWLGALLMVAGAGGLLTTLRPWKRGAH